MPSKSPRTSPKYCYTDSLIKTGLSEIEMRRGVRQNNTNLICILSSSLMGQFKLAI